MSQCSSQPSSPTYDTRRATHGTPATAISAAVSHRNASLLKSASVSGASTSRARGPVTASRPVESVTSVTVTSSPSAACWTSQSRSWLWPMIADVR